MDVKKFRKLISRLSIKERMRTEKNMSSCPSGGDSQINPQDVSTPPQLLNDSLNNNNNESSNNRIVLIPHPTNYWPESNILTQIQFPCPTLIRKNKCSTAMIEECFYEELKPKVQEPTEIPELIVAATTEVSESSPEVSEGDVEGDKDAQVTEIGDNNGNDNENVYINLQELEQARRRLIAAQCVRAKYAEKWIDGQVEEESIVGNNREKTKIYWETQMRKEQSEKNKAQHKYWNNNAPSSELIIQKMNAEIEELHRREKELKRKKGELDDEEDVFSSNTSSVDEFENSDSPRLESGFYSNAGEDESIQSPEGLEITVIENRSLTDSPVPAEQEIAIFSAEVQGSDGLIQEIFSVLDEPEIANEPESPAPVFTFQKETPIEREIRLGRERDNEYKMRRISSSTSNLSGSGNEFASLPATPVTKDVKQPRPPVRTFSTTTSTVVTEEKVVATAKSPQSSRDIQYQMATERLKKEMQEAKEREEELKGRELNQDQTPSTPTKSYVPSYVEPVKTVVSRFEVVEKRQQTQQRFSISSNSSEPNDLPEKAPIKDTTPQAEVRGLPELVNGNAELTEPRSPTETSYNNTFTRPKFNSIERYLLKSSLKLRIGKNFQIPTAAAVFEPEPVVVAEEKTEEEEEVVPPTPRRKLVRAQDKIDQELREMREREKEFATRRAFKSTPDLTQENNTTNSVVNLENNNEKHGAQPQVVNRQTSKEVLETKERRRSALINQWEEKIQGGN